MPFREAPCPHQQSRLEAQFRAELDLPLVKSFPGQAVRRRDLAEGPVSEVIARRSGGAIGATTRIWIVKVGCVGEVDRLRAKLEIEAL